MKTLIEVESLLADKLSIIKEGQGDWALCIQAIEAYGNERQAQAFEEAAEKLDSLPTNPRYLGELFREMAAAVRKGSA